MVSFYALPSSILGNDKYRTLHAAYSYYYFHTSTPLLQLMNDALILARRQDFDVFNALDILRARLTPCVHLLLLPVTASVRLASAIRKADAKVCFRYSTT